MFKPCFTTPLCQELKESATELLFGGHETTASAATSLIAFLGLHHDVLQKVRKELQVKVRASLRAISQNGGSGEVPPGKVAQTGLPLTQLMPCFWGEAGKHHFLRGASSVTCLLSKCHGSIFLSRGYCAVTTKRSSWTWRSWSS